MIGVGGAVHDMRYRLLRHITNSSEQILPDSRRSIDDDDAGTGDEESGSVDPIRYHVRALSEGLEAVAGGIGDG